MNPGPSPIGLIEPLLLLVPILIGIRLIVRGFRGRLVLSAPRCRKCGQDLRRSDDAWDKCPECGIDLSDGRFVAFGRAKRRPLVAVAGLAVTVVGPPVVLLGARGVMYLMRPRPQTAQVAMMNPMSVKTATNDELIAALVADPAGPWIWQEVDARHGDGRMDDEDVRAVIAEVVAVLEEAPIGAMPLTWSRDSLARWRMRGIIDAPLDQRLRMVRVSPLFHMPLRVRPGEDVEFTISSGSSVAALVRIERVRVAGGEALDVSYDDSPPGVVGPRRPERGTCRMPLEPGEHEVVVDLEVGLLDALDGEVLGRSSPLPARDAWPEGIVTRYRSLRRTITVVPEDRTIVQTIVHEGLREEVRRILEPEGVGVQVTHDRARLVLVRPNEAVQPPVALAFRVWVIFDGQRFEVERFSRTSRGSSSSGGGDVPDARALPRTLGAVDVLFEPYFDRVRASEQGAGLEYWGEEVLFEDVKLRWYEPHS